MIIDAHAHAFPNLSGPCGHDSLKSHFDSLQVHFTGLPERVRRTADNVPVPREMLRNEAKHFGVNTLLDVDFRVGAFGRVEWTTDDVDYNMTWLPPGMRESEHLPDMLIAKMDYAGVDKAVLHNAHIYGLLNEYLADCVRRYPKRLAAIAQIQEWRADQQDEILGLRKAIAELGLFGVYFQTEGLFRAEHQSHFDDSKFLPLWEEISSLAIPVLWNIRPVAEPRAQSYLDQIRRLGIWARRHPNIQAVFTHGLHVRYLMDESGRITIPKELVDVLELPNMTLELLFPIMQSGVWDYPYTESHDIIKFLYNRLGSSKMIWGSDIPSTERYCTYRQSLDYLRKHCGFISSTAMDAILGGNAVTIFHLG